MSVPPAHGREGRGGWRREERNPAPSPSQAWRNLHLPTWKMGARTAWLQGGSRGVRGRTGRQHRVGASEGKTGASLTSPVKGRTVVCAPFAPAAPMHLLMGMGTSGVACKAASPGVTQGECLRNVTCCYNSTDGAGPSCGKTPTRLSSACPRAGCLRAPAGFWKIVPPQTLLDLLRPVSPLPG